MQALWQELYYLLQSWRAEAERGEGRSHANLNGNGEADALAGEEVRKRGVRLKTDSNKVKVADERPQDRRPHGKHESQRDRELNLTQTRNPTPTATHPKPDSQPQH